MAVLKCKMCGGDIELSADKTFGTCEFCGSTMTFPKVDDEQRAAAFNRGNHFRRMGEFDKALAVYERIVQEDENDAEAHWCCALCRFGIEYVEDPNTLEYLPTCHRASFDSFLEDVDYLAALEHSTGVTRRQYQKDAQKIAEVQRGILATSQNEEPFDVFICYKESENDGSRTRDSLYAQDIYYQLTEQGRRVFFSRITLEDKAGTEYEPYIFAALNSAKVMILVTTSAEHANAVWVKNEWSRFLSLMRKDRSKLLLPCYRDMDPYDLPEALSVLQSYDMSKIGFIQDLIRGVNKVLDAQKPKETVRETVKETVVMQTAPTASSAGVAPLLERAFMFLEDGNWQSADEYCEKVLDQDPKNARAYVGKLMAELHVRKLESLKDCAEPFDDQSAYQKALRFGDDKLKAELTGAVTHIRERNELAWKERLYQKILVCMKKDTEDDLMEAIRYCQLISGWRDADEQAAVCEKRIQEIKAKEEAYRIERERKAEEERIAEEKAAKKRKKIIAIVTPIFVACIAFWIVLSEIIIPNQKYNTAVELYNAGKYKDALAVFTALDGHKDSAAQIKKCETAIKDEKYAAAVELYSAGKYEEAIVRFKALDGYKDSKTQIEICETAIKDEKYAAAVEMYNAGQYEGAISAFEELYYYKDSKEQLIESKYAFATELYNSGKYEEAIDAFAELAWWDNHKDSAEKIDEIKCSAEWIKICPVRGTFFFGSYEQDNDTSNGKEDIEWIVLAREEDKILVISEYGLDCRRYNSTYTDVTWETCSLRTWLNETFLNEAFGSEEQKCIISAIVTADENPSYDTSSGNNTTDKLFLLSIQEVENCMGSYEYGPGHAEIFFLQSDPIECYRTEYCIAQSRASSTDWWLRSPGKSSDYAACVSSYGTVRKEGDDVYDYNVVRPAMWIDIGSD